MSTYLLSKSISIFIVGNLLLNSYIISG
ncbi:hypothetical protein D050_4891A, partial [Vibrio parahaemolyticus VPCR-2009]